MREEFLTIFNDKKLSIPTKQIQNGDLIQISIEKVYASENLKAQVKKRLVIPL